MEASISSMKASTEAFMEAGSHGSFHELPRKKQVVQQTETSAHSRTRTNRQR